MTPAEKILRPLICALEYPKELLDRLGEANAAHNVEHAIRLADELLAKSQSNDEYVKVYDRSVRSNCLSCGGAVCPSCEKFECSFESETACLRAELARLKEENKRIKERPNLPNPFTIPNARIQLGSPITSWADINKVPNCVK